MTTAQIAPKHRDIEPREVKNLGHVPIRQQALQIGRLILSGRELDGVTHAIAGRKLRETKTVAKRVEAKRFSVDGNGDPKSSLSGKSPLWS